MRLAIAMPQMVERLKPLYFVRGEKIGGSAFLPRALRYKILKAIRDLVEAKGMKFGVCREGLEKLNTATCDGSWLMPKTKEGLR